MFYPPEWNPYGVYSLRLWIDGEWKYVIVDDKLLCFNGRPSFSSCRNENEFWVMLLEKAVAKVSGGYQNLLMLRTKSKAYQMLTKATPETEFFTPEHSVENLEFIKQALAQNSVVVCGTFDNKAVNEVGLRENHAYTVVGAELVGGEELLKLRNPHGKGEWNGKWSDSSAELQEAMSMKKISKHQISDDGFFFIPWDEFLKYFRSVTIATPNDNVYPFTKVWKSEWKTPNRCGGLNSANNPQLRIGPVLQDTKFYVTLSTTAAAQTGISLRRLSSSQTKPMVEFTEGSPFGATVYGSTDLSVDFEVVGSPDHVYILIPISAAEQPFCCVIRTSCEAPPTKEWNKTK
jgi:hypothetical protein